MIPLAAAAAARINAQIQAKKGIQHVEVPPIRAVSFIPSHYPKSLIKHTLDKQPSSYNSVAETKRRLKHQQY